MRLIDADELRNHWLYDTIGNNPEFTPNDVLDSIDECPTIEPVKHAHWKSHTCSNCSLYCDAEFYEYCPYCGAKMDEEDK